MSKSSAKRGDRPRAEVGDPVTCRTPWGDTTGGGVPQVIDPHANLVDFGADFVQTFTLRPNREWVMEGCPTYFSLGLIRGIGETNVARGARYEAPDFRRPPLADDGDHGQGGDQ